MQIKKKKKGNNSNSNSDSEEERPKTKTDREDDRGLKLDIPEFNGKSDPEDFFEWIRAAERIFEYKGMTTRLASRWQH